MYKRPLFSYFSKAETCFQNGFQILFKLFQILFKLILFLSCDYQSIVVIH